MSSDMVTIEKSPSDNEVTSTNYDDHYPWGTSISLDDDMVQKLGLGNLNAGDVVEIRAFAFVESKSESQHRSDGETKTDSHMSFQMTKMKISESSDSDRAGQLYGDN